MTWARKVPAKAQAGAVVEANVSVLPSFSTVTFFGIGKAPLPLLPFTFTAASSIVTSTPVGTSIGFLAILDIFDLSLMRPGRALRRRGPARGPRGRSSRPWRWRPRPHRDRPAPWAAHPSPYR